MKPVIDADAILESPSPRALAPLASYAALPDLHDAPKRRIHPMIVGFLGFAGATIFFYGSEAVAPIALKPSSIIGGYQHNIAEAHKSGELTAQVRYDAQLRGIELQYQGQLKQIESAAGQWQEQYRVSLNGMIEDYRGVYARANIFAQATADLQKQYAAARYSITERSLGGETGMANMATTVGLLGGLFDKDFGDSALAYADQVRGRAFAKLDEAARGGVTVSVEGWNEGLPDPQALQERLRNLPPLRLPTYEPRNIVVPEPQGQ